MVLAIVVPMVSLILVLKFGTRRDLIVEYDGRRIVVEDRGIPPLEVVHGRSVGGKRPVVSNTSYWEVKGAFDTIFEWNDLYLDLQGTRARWAAIEDGRRGPLTELRLEEGQEAVIGPDNRVDVHRMGPVPGDP